jgi:hypothetical protein
MFKDTIRKAEPTDMPMMRATTGRMYRAFLILKDFSNIVAYIIVNPLTICLPLSDR